jgi:hypothetical protein
MPGTDPMVEPKDTKSIGHIGRNVERVESIASPGAQTPSARRRADRAAQKELADGRRAASGAQTMMFKALGLPGGLGNRRKSGSKAGPNRVPTASRCESTVRH